MTIANYDDLKTRMADTLMRSDLTSDIPAFIDMAEADFNRNVRHWKMEARTTFDITARFVDLPADWRSTVRLMTTSGSTQELELISQAELLDRKRLAENTAGCPKYYALVAGQLEVYPAPDDTYPAELVYIQDIPALSDSNTSNWLLADAPDLYLYGSLVHSAPFLKEDERISVWAQLYQNAVSGLNADSHKAAHSGSGLRVKIRGLS